MPPTTPLTIPPIAPLERPLLDFGAGVENTLEATEVVEIVEAVLVIGVDELGIVEVIVCSAASSIGYDAANGLADWSARKV